MYDQQQAATLVLGVRRAANHPRVLEVSEHFAGYFDELGITITVRPETSQEEIAGIKDQVAPVLLNARVTFKWMLMFRRDGKQVAVLFPDGLFASD